VPTLPPDITHLISDNHFAFPLLPPSLVTFKNSDDNGSPFPGEIVPDPVNLPVLETYDVSANADTKASKIHFRAEKMKKLKIAYFDNNEESVFQVYVNFETKMVYLTFNTYE